MGLVDIEEYQQLEVDSSFYLRQILNQCLWISYYNEITLYDKSFQELSTLYDSQSRTQGAQFLAKS